MCGGGRAATYVGRMLTKAKGYATSLRSAGRVARAESAHVNAGQPGEAWKMVVALDGIAEARREELVSEMQRRTGTPPGEPVGDGKLRIRANMNAGFSLQVATAGFLAEATVALHDCGMAPEEFSGVNAELEVEPDPEPDRAPEPPRGLRGALARRTGMTAHGLLIAAADQFDIGVRQATGDHVFDVVGDLDELHGSYADGVRDQMTAITGAVPQVNDGVVEFLVDCHQVGTALGALLLVARRMGSAFEQASPHSTLRMLAVPSDSTDDA